MISQRKRTGSRVARALEEVLWLIAVPLTLVGNEALIRIGGVPALYSRIAVFLLLDLVGYLYLRRRTRRGR